MSESNGLGRCAKHNDEVAKLMMEACVAAVKYDNAICGRAANGEVELNPLGAIAEGVDLDELYFDWIGKARAAIAKATGDAP